MKKIILLVILAIAILGCSQEEKTYNVSITCQEGGFYYIEVVTEAYFDDMKLSTNGTTNIEVKGGNHRLIYSYANINGYGMYLDEKTKNIEIEVDEDMEILVSGGLVYY